MADDKSEDEIPTGMPPEAEGGGEEDPLGVDEALPDQDAMPDRGADAMPGIATDGEPPSGG